SGGSAVTELAALCASGVDVDGGVEPEGLGRLAAAGDEDERDRIALDALTISTGDLELFEAAHRDRRGTPLALRQQVGEVRHRCTHTGSTLGRTADGVTDVVGVHPRVEPQTLDAFAERPGKAGGCG